MPLPLLNNLALQILLTPLTRRVFASNGSVAESLFNERARTLVAAAQADGGVVLDLNRESTRYVNAVGEKAAHGFDMAEGDHTHLNALGKTVFGNMVAGLVARAADAALIPGLTSTYFELDAAISAKLKAGAPIS